MTKHETSTFEFRVRGHGQDIPAGVTCAIGLHICMHVGQFDEFVANHPDAVTRHAVKIELCDGRSVTFDTEAEFFKAIGL